MLIRALQCAHLKMLLPQMLLALAVRVRALGELDQRLRYGNGVLPVLFSGVPGPAVGVAQDRACLSSRAALVSKPAGAALNDYRISPGKVTDSDVYEPPVCSPTFGSGSPSRESSP